MGPTSCASPTRRPHIPGVAALRSTHPPPLHQPTLATPALPEQGESLTRSRISCPPHLARRALPPPRAARRRPHARPRGRRHGNAPPRPAQAAEALGVATQTSTLQIERTPGLSSPSQPGESRRCRPIAALAPKVPVPAASTDARAATPAWREPGRHRSAGRAQVRHRPRPPSRHRGKLSPVGVGTRPARGAPRAREAPGPRADHLGARQPLYPLGRRRRNLPPPAPRRAPDPRPHWPAARTPRPQRLYWLLIAGVPPPPPRPLAISVTPLPDPLACRRAPPPEAPGVGGSEGGAEPRSPPPPPPSEQRGNAAAATRGQRVEAGV